MAIDKSIQIIIIKIILMLSLITNNIENDNFVYKKIYNYQKFQTNSSLLKIFIMTHKDFDNARNNPIYNIVADDKSQLKNNYSLNIIYANEGNLYNKKKAYSEISKLYFIYQLYKKGKMTSKYIGLNHYRRYFIFGDNVPYLENLFKNYDVILNKQYHLKKSIRKQYCKIHICKNYDEILNIIKETKPEYYKTAKRTSKERKLYICNLFIMKKEDFFKYCKFMFDILFEFDKRNNLTSDDDVLNYSKNYYNNSVDFDYQSRLQSFLSERISNIFFKHHFKRIKEFDIIFVNNQSRIRNL